MDKTNVIVGSPNIEGNIGSCEIKSTNISTSAFYVKTIAVNSCNGAIVAENGPYFDSTWIAIPIILFCLFAGLRAMFE